MARLFGTDGVRGLANVDLTPELALAIASAAAAVLTDGSTRPRVVVGRDPRASGEMLENAVVAGLTAAGADAIRVGVLPTPAVAYLTDRLGADFGIMLSASHNAMPDNGIKIFAAGGHKLDDAVEDAIEAQLALPMPRPTGSAIGRVLDHHIGGGEYVEHLLTSLGGPDARPLAGLKVVVDCANGAASSVAADAYRRAGAELITIHATPDGLNINADCGSTHIGDLVSAVREVGADAGIAHDGDADRCLAVDADGDVVDGDHILAILALSMRERGLLHRDTVVSTVMANLGFTLAMRDAGIEVLATAVGDRYVLEEMRREGYTLGGEQSGHVIMSEHATTGDGILTALHLLAEVSRSGMSLADLASVVTKLPQVLVNVKGVDKAVVAASPEVAEAVLAAEAMLGQTGRVLLRPSGTEPVVRVMVEAPSQEQAEEVAGSLAAVIRGLG
ncbi:MAG: phosphoglucosamine mutase [Actinomycetales bacterium]|nr:phosphoglucosamine mutase [Actinomycetales bacterium]